MDGGSQSSTYRWWRAPHAQGRGVYVPGREDNVGRGTAHQVGFGVRYNSKNSVHFQIGEYNVFGF